MAKILHLGNIANNAYNNAKYLNLDGSHEHSALNYDNPHIMACPEWEEIDTFDEINEFAPNWGRYSVHLPKWYKYIETSTLNASGEPRPMAWLFSGVTCQRRKLAYWLKDQGLKKNGRSIKLPVTLAGRALVLLTLPVYVTLHVLQKILAKSESQNHSFLNDKTGYGLLASKLEQTVGDCDLIQAYGADIIIPYLMGKPFIAYEHGTLRDLPFDGTARGEQLSKAYQSAEYTIITNPDVILSAKKLALSNYIYIPHAVDCDRFTPSASPILKKKFGLEDSFVVVAPARQNWDVKGNQKYIKAFAEFFKIHTNAKLFICDWGQHRDLTKQLVSSLELDQCVTYYTPCPKLTSINYYQMADVVIDQFEAGAFGGITPEAMACEKPVLVYYREDVHDWCFENHPPVINVQTEVEIFDALTALKNDAESRQRAGEKGREWVLKEYSIKQLVERHNKLYNATQRSHLSALAT